MTMEKRPGGASGEVARSQRTAKRRDAVLAEARADDAEIEKRVDGRTVISRPTKAKP